MKNLKKIFAVAMSIATVAMSTSAFAATYDAEAETVSLEAADLSAIAAVDGVNDNDQMTVVIVPSDFGAEDSGDIYYINQDAITIKDGTVDTTSGFGQIVSAMGVKDGFAGVKLEAGTTWQVRVGGTNVDEVKTFAFAIDDEGEVTIDYGNVDGANNVEPYDASLILQYLAGRTVEDFANGGITFDVAAVDANGDGTPEPYDATVVLLYCAGSGSLGPVVTE